MKSLNLFKHLYDNIMLLTWAEVVDHSDLCEQFDGNPHDIISIMCKLEAYEKELKKVFGIHADNPICGDLYHAPNNVVFNKILLKRGVENGNYR